MAEIEEKKTATKADLDWPNRPKDSNGTESRYSYYARKYFEGRSARSNTNEGDYVVNLR